MSYICPTLEADFLGPESVSVDVVGSSLDGGRNGNGQTLSIEMSGGGNLVATYENCKIVEPEQFEYVNWLGARLNGGFRFINVPIITDWYGPFRTKDSKPYLTAGATHSDDSSFADGSLYSQPTVFGKMREYTALGAGIIKVRLYDAPREIRWSDWFAIQHPNKGWRAYRNWDVLSKGTPGTVIEDGATRTFTDYQLAISPALREAALAGTRVEFVRPKFVGKFASGFTLPSRSVAFYALQQSIEFSEAW